MTILPQNVNAGMGEYIRFLDLHGSGITALATAILVLITAVYALITHRILLANERAISETLRPYVVVNIYCEDLKLYIDLRNHGQRPAHYFNCSIEPPIDERLVDKRIGTATLQAVLKQALIAPGQSIRHVLALNPDIFRHVEFNDIRRQYSMSLTYSNSDNKEFVDHYPLDLGGVLIANKVMDKSTNSHLKEIEKAIKELDKTIRETLKR